MYLQFCPTVTSKMYVVTYETLNSQIQCFLPHALFCHVRHRQFSVFVLLSVKNLSREVGHLKDY